MIFKADFNSYNNYNKYVFSFNRALKNLVLVAIILAVFNLFVNWFDAVGLGLSNFVNFINYFFLVLIFSLGVNAGIFFIKAQEEERKIKSEYYYGRYHSYIINFDFDLVFVSVVSFISLQLFEFFKMSVFALFKDNGIDIDTKFFVVGALIFFTIFYFFVNYVFLGIIFSFGNLDVFSFKAYNEEKKIENYGMGDFKKSLKNFLLFLFIVFALWSLKGVGGILEQIDIKKFFISGLIVSSIVFYFYNKSSVGLLKERISLSDDLEINFSGDNFKVESFEEDTQKFAIAKALPLEKEENFIKNSSLDLSLENLKNFPSENLKNFPLENLKNFPSFADMLVKLASIKSDKESLQSIKSLINMLNSTLLDGEFDLTSFNHKIDALTLLFYILLYNGKKFLPMLIIAYFVYLYQRINNSEGRELLRLRLKSLVNSKNVNTPKRMVEILLSWQYIHKANYKPIPSIKGLPKFFKKLLKVTLENYRPLTLKKSKMLNYSIKLADLIKILHPKPANNLLAVLYGGIIQNSKISKLKKDEYLPNIIKKDEIMLEKIKKLPINALLRNLKNINFENNRLSLALEERLKNIVNDIDKLKRFVNIFDFYMPFFILSEKDISEVFYYIKNQKVSNIIKENLDISKLLSHFWIEKMAISIAKESFNFAAGGIDIDTIEKISVAIDCLLLAEKFMRLLISSPDRKLYSFMNQERFLSIKNRDKIKSILNEVLYLYFEKNKVNQSIDIIIKLDKTVDFSLLAKAVSFLTSKYKYYKIVVISNKMEVYTDQYNRIVSPFKPINRYLRTIAFFTELFRFSPVVSDISMVYGYLYEYILNSSGNFVVLDSFPDKYYLNEVFRYVSKMGEYSKKENKGVIYDYQAVCPGYHEIKNFVILSAGLDNLTFDIIDSLVAK